MRNYAVHFINQIKENLYVEVNKTEKSTLINN